MPKSFNKLHGGLLAEAPITDLAVVPDTTAVPIFGLTGEVVMSAPVLDITIARDDDPYPGVNSSAERADRGDWIVHYLADGQYVQTTPRDRLSVVERTRVRLLGDHGVGSIDRDTLGV